MQLFLAIVLTLSVAGGISPTKTSAASFIWPAGDKDDVTSTYGERWGDFHHGIDIAIPGTVPIKASASGKVRSSTFGSPGNYNGYGNVVVITHNIGGKTYETLYGHLRSRSVSQGETVSQGEVIGYMGSTGNSTGQHLHFEIHDGTYNGTQSNSTDPMKLLGTDFADTPPSDTFKVIKLDSDQFGLYSKMGTYKESSTPYLGWTFVVKQQQIYNGERWYLLVHGDKVFGWIAAHQTSEYDNLEKKYLNEDVDAYNYNLDQKIMTLNSTGYVYVAKEYSDKYLVIAHSQPMYIAKKLVNFDGQYTMPYKAVKITSDAYGINSTPGVYKESSTPYLNWILVSKEQTTYNNQKWYKLSNGSTVYGWISGNQVQELPMKRMDLTVDTKAYNYGFKEEIMTLNGGGFVLVIGEGNDYYHVAAHSQTMYIKKTLKD
jgi:Peptidase family M23/GW (Gly-Tryp) dipeptide domain